MEYKTLALPEVDDRFATIDMGRKEGGAGPHLTQCGLDSWADIYLCTKWHLDPSSPLTDGSRCHLVQR